jgi:hypothetical protein
MKNLAKHESYKKNNQETYAIKIESKIGSSNPRMLRKWIPAIIVRKWISKKKKG